ncbi:MAG: nickel pincer cofactor biosynthesis protein LarC [Nitrospiraceae bacterium]|nr:nickel pincer cofactor biosynthesis protein LarC [Nitrospiraceae bacterium]
MKTPASKKDPVFKKKKIIWLDCSRGISGDMLIGALISAGAPLRRLESELFDKIPLKDVRLGARRVRRMGFAATKFDVKEAGFDVKEAGGPRFGWDEIRRLVKESTLPDGIRETGLGIMKSLFDAEAKIHGLRAETVHLHELGSADTIVDVFGALVCLKLLGVEEVFSSPVNLGGGTVDTRHGRLPVPAPATALLLEGLPVYGGPPLFELTTPTGAALVKGLAKGFSQMPYMTLRKCGCGAGRMDFKDFPNVLRAFIGETPGAEQKHAENDVTVIETNIDDMSPQIYGHLMERLFKAGALDVFLTPIIMKKGRPAIKITALCNPQDAPRMKEIIFSETTTLGVRFHQAGRTTLPREIETFPTVFGPIRFKISYPDGEGGRADGKGKRQEIPEYEDCLKAARKTGVPLKEVFRRLNSSRKK